MSVVTHQHEPSLVDSPAFRVLKQNVIRQTGLAYYTDKDDALARAVQRRLQASGTADLATYLERLQTPDEDEWNVLIDSITIGETYFFRYPNHFDALRSHVATDCLSDGGSLRIWSAGCSNGAETYSISIVLQRDLHARLDRKDISILGTDISLASLRAAKVGHYSNWDLRGVSDEEREECFLESGKRWQLRETFKRDVEFMHHNLVDSGESFWNVHAGRFDVIFCRNVLIYFDMQTCRRVLARFRECLRPGGWLIVGHAESFLEIAKAFEPVQLSGMTLYRNSGHAAAEAVGFASSPGTAAPGADASAKARRPEPGEIDWRPPRLWPMPSFLHEVETGPIPSAEDKSDEEDQCSDRLAAARQLANSGRWAEAEQRCREALSLDALDAEARYLLSLVLEQQGERAAAKKSLKQALYADHSFALAHFQLGMLRIADGEPAEAERGLRNVSTLLRDCEGDEVLRGGEGLTAAELAEIVRIHLAALRTQA